MFVVVWGFFTFCFLKVSTAIMFWNPLNITSCIVITALALFVMFIETGLMMGRRSKTFLSIMLGSSTRAGMIIEMLYIVGIACLIQAALGVLLVVGFDGDMWENLMPSARYGVQIDYTEVWKMAAVIGTPVLLHGAVNVILLSKGPEQHM